MDIYKYLMFAKDFILDRQFLNLLISTFILFLASLLAWYIYYKQLARRDLFDIPKLNLKMKFVSIVDRMVYILKYLFIFPVYSFMWFLLFSFLLFALSKSRPIEDILFLGIIAVEWLLRIGRWVITSIKTTKQ